MECWSEAGLTGAEVAEEGALDNAVDEGGAEHPLGQLQQRIRIVHKRLYLHRPCMIDPYISKGSSRIYLHMSRCRSHRPAYSRVQIRCADEHYRHAIGCAPGKP